MPHILDAQIPEVNPTGAPGGDFEQIRSSPEAFGAFGAQAEEKFGAGLEKAGNTGIDYATEQNALQSRIHATSLNSWFADQAGDLLSKFTDNRGRAALDALPDYRKQLGDLRTQAMGQAGSLREKADLAASLGSLSNRYDAWGTTHADTERKQWQQKTTGDAIESAGNQALIALNHNDRNAFDSEIGIAADTTAATLKSQGYDDQTIAAETARTRGKFIAQAVRTYVDQGNPQAAGALASDYSSAIDPKSRLEIENYLAPKLTAQGGSVLGSVAMGRTPPQEPFNHGESTVGVPTGLVSRTIGLESGGDPNAVTGKNVGLGQFGPQEMRKYGITDPGDYGQVSRAILTEAEENKPALTKALGRPPTGAELYLAHQQGQAGAAALFSNPDKPAWEAIRKFYGSDQIAKQAIWGNMSQSMKAQFPGGVETVSGGNFALLWSGRYQRQGQDVGIIDKGDAYRKLDGMQIQNPNLYRAAKSYIDQEYNYQETANAQRRGELQATVPGVIQAVRDGDVTKSLPPDVMLMGPVAGPRAQAEYASAVAEGQARHSMVFASPEEIGQLRGSLSSGPGAEEFRQQDLKSFDAAVQARNKLIFGENGKGGDPAAYVQAHPDLMAAAQKIDPANPATVDDYVTKSLALQAHLGVPPEQQKLLTNQKASELTAKLSSPAAAGGSGAVVSEIDAMSKMWGNNWPMVYRQLGKDMEPVARVVGSGIKPAAAQVLAETSRIPLAEILKDQDAEKAADVKKEVLDAFKPLASTLGGQEGAISIFNDFRGQGEKLAAYYVMNGAKASDAATKAFDDLIGFKYEFRDGYRIPKGMPYASDDIGAGAQAAKDKLTDYEFQPPKDTMGGLTSDYLAKVPAGTLRREGVWVTSPDEKGLALIWRDAAVKTKDGTPLVIPWSELAARGQASRGAGNVPATVTNAL